MSKNYAPSPWLSGTSAPTPVIGVERLHDLLNKVTNYELYEVVNKVYFETKYPEEHPILSSGETKAQRIDYLIRWVVRHPQARASQLLLEKLEAKVAEKEQYPVRGQVPGTKYISWKEFTSLKSYPLIASAVDYRHDYRRLCSPVTKDGYVSVDAIYNMSAWASWKSSSLSAADRQISQAIQSLNLYELMKLNKGRRADQPALFPVGLLPGR